MARSCATCHKAPPEKADWKAHKKVCGKGARASTNDDAPTADQVLSPPKGLEQPISTPFTRLDKGTWLHDRPEKDVYRLLIDAYRLRVEDDFTMEGSTPEDSIYGGSSDGLRGFRRFLQSAASRPGLLPPWWSPEKQRECEAFGMGASGPQFQNLRGAVEKSDIIEHYGDPRFPMQLRMFAEAVLGRGPGGQNGSAMRGLMVAMEGGTSEFGTATTVDALTGNRSTFHSAGRN